MVVTTVKLDEEGGEGHERLVLDQVAEKDLLYRADSSVVFEGDGSGDVMTMTLTIQPSDHSQEQVVGSRKFIRYHAQELPHHNGGHNGHNGHHHSTTENGHTLQVPTAHAPSRKMSSPF